MKHVDDVRYAMFLQNYAPKKHDDPLEKIKGINPSSMPPCQAVLTNKIKRANYVAAMWKGATLPNPCVLQPEANGWVKADEAYQIKWFEGDQVPQSICKILDPTSFQEEEDDENDEMSYGETLYGPDDPDDEDI